MLKALFLPKPLGHIVIDDIAFEIKHTQRKNMKRMILRVQKKNEIRLSSTYLSKKRCVEFILESKEWILDQHQRVQDQFSEGKSFYYLAKAYTLKHHTKTLVFDNKNVYLNLKSAKKQSDDFYKKSAKAYIPARLDHWKNTMELDFNEVRFRCAKSRWGSCSSKGIITFNPYMMKLNHEMIDYIIVHELAHLREMNHSKAFYRLVEEYFPNYKAVQKEIKDLSVKMSME